MCSSVKNILQKQSALDYQLVGCAQHVSSQSEHRIFHITRPFKSVLLTLTLKCVYQINHLSIVIGSTQLTAVGIPPTNVCLHCVENTMWFSGTVAVLGSRIEILKHFTCVGIL